ncbi:MAG: insulinase family protein, partial [Ginsengibacter sp.]
SQYARQVAWAGKDYAKNPAGTEETVKSLRVVEVKAYYKSLLTKSRMVIVVVADLDRATLEKKIGTMLSAIPDGKPFQLKKQTYSPKQNTFVSEKKDYATNYIQGVTGAPLPGSTEYNAFMIAMRIFRDRNFLEVRTNNGLSYAPRTLFDDGVSPTANIMVSTTNPNKYVGVVQSLISKIKKEGFTPDEIKNMKSTYITRFYYNQETNNAQAGSLATYEVLHNDWHKALNMNEDLKKVNVADVNNVFNKYVTNLTWVYQGNPEQADVKLFTGAMTQQKLPPSKVKSKVNN